MQKIKQEVGELRWRIKGSAGLALLGAFLGAVAWVWPALGGEADLALLARVLGDSAGDPYFWAVVGLCAALGGWLAWMIFWRSARPIDRPRDGGDPGGMSAPKF